MSLRELPNYELFKLVAPVVAILGLIVTLLSPNPSTEIKIGVLIVLVTAIFYLLYKANRYNIPPFALVPYKFKITLNYTGIKHGSPKLRGSDYEEQECLSNLHDRLQFMGVHGSRWIDEQEEMDEKMEETIKAAERNSGEIRFLIVHPDNEAYQNNRPGSNSYKDCYDKYAELANQYPDTFKVRLYDKLPNFRITTIDRRQAYISRYFFDPDSHGYDDQPMVELDREPRWNFVESYLKYFELQWEDATPINDCQLDGFSIEPNND